MPRALLAGAFGQGNLGDEALLQAFVDALPGWHLAVTTTDPASARRVGCDPVPARAPAAVARQALRADAVLVGGGTVFKTLHPSSARHPLALLANTTALVAAASVLRRPVAMVGVGAGSLGGWRTRTLTRSIVRHADLLILRDEESAGAMTAAGAPGPLRVGADPAWTLVTPPEGAHAARSSTVRVVPSTQAAGPDGGAAMLRDLTEALHLLLSSGATVQLQAWQGSTTPAGQDDTTLVDELSRRLDRRARVLPTPASLPDAVDSLAGVGAVLSYRFHALVAAGAAGVPFVAVAHEAKLGALARRLEQRAVPAGIDPGVLATHVADALGGPGTAPAAVKEQIDRAVDGFRLLRVLLSGGDTDEADLLGALPLAPSPAPAASVRSASPSEAGWPPA